MAFQLNGVNARQQYVDLLLHGRDPVHASGIAMNPENQDSKLFWLLRRTSLPSQTLHSATSFLLMAGMARLAPSHAFALAAAFFMLVTLCSSLNIYLLSSTWLRLMGDDAATRLERFSLWLSGISALFFGFFWWGYRSMAFGAAPFSEVLSVGLAAAAYLQYFARRRQLLLSGRFAMAVLADAIRALLIVGAAVAAFWCQGVFDFDRFLLIFVLAHVLGVLPVMSWRSNVVGLHLPLHSMLVNIFSPLNTLRKGDWLAVGSGAANVVFSQSASLLAPMLIGSIEYATLRAYELWLFPVFFMAQIFDPIYMRKLKTVSGGVSGQRSSILATLAWPALAIFSPLGLVCLLAWLWPPAATFIQFLISPEYRGSFWLMTWVLVLSGLIAINAPLRWYMTVAGVGKPLLIGTGLGIVFTLIVLFILTKQYPAAWTILCSKITYELVLFVAGSWGLSKLSQSAKKAANNA
jgi:hypothetical protein